MVRQSHAAGAVSSTASDLHKWMLLLSTYQVLSKQSLAVIWAPTIKMSNPNYSYGYGWIIPNKPLVKYVFHNGVIDGFRSCLIYFPKEMLSIIVLVNHESAPVTQAALDIVEILFPKN